MNRDSFPGLDRAFTTSAQQQQQHRILYDERISPDHSICSQQTSSSFQASSLDMSIGARAALNEHLRHVALHGLDGQQSSADTSVSFERLPQDEVWDRILDGNLSVTSNSSPTLFERLQPVVSITEDGYEAVEVEIADESSDFFNSSKVWQLATPEKNKELRRSITTRRGMDEHDISHNDGSDSGSHESGMMYLYNAAVAMHEQYETSEHNASFLSLGVDLSRISNSDVSDIRSSPDETSYHHQRSIFFAEDFLPHDVLTPSRRGSTRDHSFSTPSRRGILMSTEPLRVSPNRHSVSAMRGYGETENYLNLSADIGLSPIAAQAGSIAVKLGRPSRRHHPGDAFPLFSPSGSSPNGLVDRMQGLRMDEPSPISQANSGFDLRKFPVSENCILDMDDQESSSKSASSPPDLKPRDPCQRHMSSLSTISATSPAKQHSTSGSSEDRRRYRTVVPARVFMDQPDNFPLQDDSFSARTGTASSTSDDSDTCLSSRLPARSLLVSFDDAADEFEVPLIDSYM